MPNAGEPKPSAPPADAPSVTTNLRPDPPLLIADQEILPGETRRVELSVARLYDYTEQTITLKVVRGKRPGPTLLVSAAIHGDEVNGVEIVRRLLRSKALKNLRGTLIAAPIVNVFGFNSLSRYLPDRRDLNRCFPGSSRGPLASRIAYLINEQVLAHCTHAIDLHTGAIHRSNLPQIRAYLADPDTLKMAHAFRSPVILNSQLRDGSLRACAVGRGIPMLLFEGGEALRFEDSVIKSGVRGILSVMRHLGMLKPGAEHDAAPAALVAEDSHWIRSPSSGIVRIRSRLGERVEEGDVLGLVSDPLGEFELPIAARHSGVVIGLTKLPMVARGDAVLHVATFEHLDEAMELVEEFGEIFDIDRLS